MSAPQNLGEALDALAPFLPEGVDFTMTHYGAYPALLGRVIINLCLGKTGGAGPSGNSTGLLSAMPLSHRLELAEEEHALAVDREAEREAKARAEVLARAAALDLLAAARLAIADCCDLIATPAGNALEAAIARASGDA